MLTFSLFPLLISFALATGPITAEEDIAGRYPSADFYVTEVAADTDRMLPQAKWYLDKEWVAIAEHHSKPVIALPDWLDSVERIAYPAPALLSAPQVIESARLAENEMQLELAEAQQIGFALVEKFPLNQDFWNADTTAFFQQRSLRLRGENIDGKFITQMVWPRDFTITADTVSPLKQEESLQSLVKMQTGGVKHPHHSRLLWEKRPGITQQHEGKPVLAVMLNGAQGDDHEALAGHFAVVTGNMNSAGSYDHWLVNNFYSLDVYSEKDILAAVTPMDNYLADVNRGQNYYRPSYMLVATLSDAAPADAIQYSLEQIMNHFYRHDFLYEHAEMNCAGISIDSAQALGWKIPSRGSNGYVKAIGGYFYTLIMERDITAAREIYDYLITETTRLLPAVAFDAMGEDLLQLAQGRSNRKLNAYETQLAEAIEALWFVRIPQFPSSRAWGDAPIYSFDEYLQTAPSNRDEWETIELEQLTLPDALDTQQPVNPPNVPLPWPIALIMLWLAGLILAGLKHVFKSG